MIINVYVPLLISAMFGVTAPSVARWLPPSAGTWLLSIGGLVAAALWSWALGLLALTVIGQNSLVAAHEHWSGSVLRALDPVAVPVAVVALIGLCVGIGRIAITTVSSVRAVRIAHSLSSALPAQGGDLTVIHDSTAIAFVVPGRPGRIVVSSGLLRVLDHHQRRAMLAHERSHLIHRHHLHRICTRVAAATNPLLAGLPAASALSTERWADEDAAAQSQRGAVVGALAHAAGHRSFPGWVGGLIGSAFGAEHLAQRVRALQAPAPTPRPWLLVLMVGLLMVALPSIADATYDASRLFELAHSVSQLRHR